MDEKNTFYGRNAEKMSRFYGIVLLFVCALDYLVEYEQKLIITIKWKKINLLFILILFLMCIFLRFSIKWLKNRKKQNYIKLFDDFLEINSQERSSQDILNNNIQCINTKIYYRDIDYIDLNSLNLKRQIGLFRVTGLKNYWNYTDSLKDVCITKKDGSTIVFPEIQNREYFGIEIKSKGIKLIINNFTLNKNSILANKNKS